MSQHKISIFAPLIKPEYFYIIIAKERTQANRLRFCNDMLGGELPTYSLVQAKQWVVIRSGER